MGKRYAQDELEELGSTGGATLGSTLDEGSFVEIPTEREPRFQLDQEKFSKTIADSDFTVGDDDSEKNARMLMELFLGSKQNVHPDQVDFDSSSKFYFGQEGVSPVEMAATIQRTAKGYEFPESQWDKFSKADDADKWIMAKNDAESRGKRTSLNMVTEYSRRLKTADPRTALRRYRAIATDAGSRWALTSLMTRDPDMVAFQKLPAKDKVIMQGYLHALNPEITANWTTEAWQRVKDGARTSGRALAATAGELGRQLRPAGDPESVYHDMNKEFGKVGRTQLLKGGATDELLNRAATIMQARELGQRIQAAALMGEQAMGLPLGGPKRTTKEEWKKIIQPLYAQGKEIYEATKERRAMQSAARRRLADRNWVYEGSLGAIQMGFDLGAAIGAGAVTTAMGAGPSGAAVYSYSRFQGEFARELIYEQGVDPDEAMAISGMVGVPYAAVEMMQVGQLGKLFGKAAPQVAKGAGDAVRRTLVDILKAKGKQTLVTMGTETTEEIIQAALEAGGRKVAKEYAGADYTDQEIVDMFKTESWEAIKTMPFVSLAGGVGGTAVDVAINRQAAPGGPFDTDAAESRTKAAQESIKIPERPTLPEKKTPKAGPVATGIDALVADIEAEPAPETQQREGPYDPSTSAEDVVRDSLSYMDDLEFYEVAQEFVEDIRLSASTLVSAGKQESLISDMEQLMSEGKSYDHVLDEAGYDVSNLPEGKALEILADETYAREAEGMSRVLNSYAYEREMSALDKGPVDRQALEEIVEATGLAKHVVIVDTKDELPSSKGVTMRNPAVYDEATGTVYMIADHVFSPEDIEDVVVEEVIGHKGVLEVVGEKGVKELVDDVMNSELSDEVHAMAKDRVLDMNTDDGKRTAVLELVADRAVKGKGLETDTLMLKVRRWFRRQLKRLGFQKNFGDLEIDAVIRNARSIYVQKQGETKAAIGAYRRRRVADQPARKPYKAKSDRYESIVEPAMETKARKAQDAAAEKEISDILEDTRGTLFSDRPLRKDPLRDRMLKYAYSLAFEEHTEDSLIEALTTGDKRADLLMRRVVGNADFVVRHARSLADADARAITEEDLMRAESLMHVTSNESTQQAVAWSARAFTESVQGRKASSQIRLRVEKLANPESVDDMHTDLVEHASRTEAETVGKPYVKVHAVRDTVKAMMDDVLPKGAKMNMAHYEEFVAGVMSVASRILQETRTLSLDREMNRVWGYLHGAISDRAESRMQKGDSRKADAKNRATSVLTALTAELLTHRAETKGKTIEALAAARAYDTRKAVMRRASEAMRMDAIDKRARAEAIKDQPEADTVEEQEAVEAEARELRDQATDIEKDRDDMIRDAIAKESHAAFGARKDALMPMAYDSPRVYASKHEATDQYEIDKLAWAADIPAAAQYVRDVEIKAPALDAPFQEAVDKYSRMDADQVKVERAKLDTRAEEIAGDKTVGADGRRMKLALEYEALDKFGDWDSKTDAEKLAINADVEATGPTKVLGDLGEHTTLARKLSASLKNTPEQVKRAGEKGEWAKGLQAFNLGYANVRKRLARAFQYAPDDVRQDVNDMSTAIEQASYEKQVIREKDAATLQSAVGEYDLQAMHTDRKELTKFSVHGDTLTPGQVMHQLHVYETADAKVLSNPEHPLVQRATALDYKTVDAMVKDMRTTLEEVYPDYEKTMKTVRDTWGDAVNSLDSIPKKDMPAGYVDAAVKVPAIKALMGSSPVFLKEDAVPTTKDLDEDMALLPLLTLRQEELAHWQTMHASGRSKAVKTLYDPRVVEELTKLHGKKFADVLYGKLNDTLAGKLMERGPVHNMIDSLRSFNAIRLIAYSWRSSLRQLAGAPALWLEASAWSKAYSDKPENVSRTNDFRMLFNEPTIMARQYGQMSEDQQNVFNKAVTDKKGKFAAGFVKYGMAAPGFGDRVASSAAGAPVYRAKYAEEMAKENASETMDELTERSTAARTALEDFDKGIKALSSSKKYKRADYAVKTAKAIWKGPVTTLTSVRHLLNYALTKTRTGGGDLNVLIMRANALERLTKDTKEMKAHRAATAHVVSVIEATQQSNQIKDMPDLIARGGSFGRSIMQFMTSPAQQYSMEVEGRNAAYAAYVRAGGKKGEAGAMATKKFWATPEGKKLVKQLVIGHMVLPLLQQLVTVGGGALLGRKPDKDDLLRTGAMLMAGPLSSLVLLGDLLGGVAEKITGVKRSWSDSEFPIQGLMGELTNLFGNLRDVVVPPEDVPRGEAAIKGVTKAASGLNPLVKDILRAVTNWSDLLGDEKVEIDDMLEAFELDD